MKNTIEIKRNISWLLCGLVILFTISSALSSIYYVNNLAVYAVSEPVRSTAIWEAFKPVVKEDRKYIVYKHKNHVKETVVEEYIKVAHNPNVAHTEFKYTTNKSQVHELTTAGTVKVSGEVGFIASGTVAVTSLLKLSWSWTSTSGVTYSQELNSRDVAGIYRLRLYTIIREYVIDTYVPNIVTKTRTYQTTEGKKTVTKTQTYQVQEGWKYYKSETQWFYETFDNYAKEIRNEIRLELVSPLPTVVG
ncbi:MAG: hypothetical protein LBE09_07230 [Christensenellaceae bacterium]|jgi:phosphohistidine phosphatase SixA|nr:hypothetical protein [Christensenellaceae bacterium]